MSMPTVAIRGSKKIMPPLKSRTRKPRRKPLTKDERAYNHALSRLRVRVEHRIARFKSFRILAEKYRYPRDRYGIKISIVAGIVNMADGF